MARHGQHFDQFRDILIEWDTPEKRGTRREDFVVLQDGRVLTLAEALDQLPEAELSSPGGFNTDQSYQPIFLDIYREPSGRYSRHSIKARWYLELEQEELQKEERRQRWVKEQFPDARYYLCEFAQDQWDRMYVRNVLSLEGETDAERARKHAEQTERKMFQKGIFDMTIQARLAASYDDARAGRFLDD